MIRNIFRRILSIASALAIVFTAYPPVIFADDGGLCPHYPEHTVECGYVEGVSPCNFVCEICNPPEDLDSTEPSDTPEPEATTSPEEQPPVTTAPEPEPVETGTTETTPEESETMPTEPIPEPDSAPAEPEVQLMSLEAGLHDHGDDDIEWTAWEKTDSLPETPGSYYLTEDVTLSDSWYVNGTVNLCLNGRNIECLSYGEIMTGGGNLTVYNCRGGGEIRKHDYDGNLVSNSYGTFTLKDGIIESSGYYAIYGGIDSSIIIDGGRVSGEESGIYLSGGNVEVNGGMIHGVKYGIEFDYFYDPDAPSSLSLSGEPIITGGIADIYLADGAKITVDSQLTAADISIQMDTPGVFATGKYAAASKGCFVPAEEGYSIIADGDGLKLVAGHAHDGGETFETPWSDPNSLPDMAGNYYLTEDVTISSIVSINPMQNINLCLNGHNVNFSTSAANYMIGSGRSLTIYDCGSGEISGNSSNPIITLGGGTFTLESGKITSTNNYANVISCSSGTCYINGGVVSGGGGIDATGGTLTVSGGQIIGGSKPGISSRANLIINGGDISSSIQGVSVVGGSFNLSGNPTIHSDSSADIDLSKGCTITINAALENETPYTITADPGVFANVEGGLIAANYIGKFSSKKDNYIVVADGSTLKLVEGHGHADGTTFDKAWNSKDSLPTEKGNYYLTTDVTLTGDWEVSGNFNLCLNGHKILCGSHAIEINSGTLTFYDCIGSGEVSGNNSYTIRVVNNNGNFVLNSGKISNSYERGIAVQVNYGQAAINGGEIEGQYNGVYLMDRGYLTVSGGKIIGGKYAIDNMVGYVTLSGSPELNGKEADINLKRGNPIKVTAPLENVEPYRITEHDNNKFATFESGLNAEDFINKFTPAVDNLDIIADGGSLLTYRRQEHDGITFKAWIKTDSLPTESGNYYLAHDVSLSGSAEISSDINLCLNGYKIETSSSIIISGGTLNIYDCNSSGYGNGSIIGSHTALPTISVESGTLTLNGVNPYIEYKKCEIKSTNNSAIVMSGGTLVINGGTITSEAGYAVSATFGGEIKLSGEPVINAALADFSIEGGTIIIDQPLTGGTYVLGGVAGRVFATGDGAEASIDHFKLTDDLIAQGYVIVAEDGGLKAVVKHEHEDSTNFETKWDKDNELPTEAGSYFLTKDVTLSANWDVSSDITLCLNGHTIDCGGNYINVKGAGVLTIYDCKDSGKITTTASEPIKSSGIIIINGGEINGRSWSIDASKGTIILNGGTLNKSIYFNNHVEIKINGGKISSTQPIYYSDYTLESLTVHGGEFNTLSDAAYGIHINIKSDGNLILSGNPTFSGGQGGIQLEGNAKIEFDGKLKTTEPIKIDVALKNQAFTVNAEKYGVKPEQFEYVGDGDYEVQKVGSELWLVPKGAHVHDDETIFLPWDKTDSLPTTAGNYYLKNNVDIPMSAGNWTVQGDTKLCLNGHSITTLSSEGIKVSAGASLTVHDCSEDQSGMITNNDYCTVSVDNGGKFTLESGKIVNTEGTNYSYAITINSGSVTIKGGVVEGYNTIFSSGDLTVSGGKINSTGEAIFANTGSLTVSGGKITSEASAISLASCNIYLSGEPEISGGHADIYTAEDYYIIINEKLVGGTYKIRLPISGNEDNMPFAKGAGAAASIDCFELTKDLIDQGYEIAIEGDALVARLRTYTITYNPGEGSDISGEPLTETKTHGTDIIISSKKFTRPGYTQIGWSTEQGARKVEYDFGANYTENENLTLYPVWELNEIHFYVDGKEEIGSLSLKVGESVKIEAKITPESAACGTVQWEISGDEICSIVTDGNTATITATAGDACMLTATADGVLTRKSLSIMVMRLDSTVSAVDQTVTYGDEVTIKAKVEKDTSNGITLMSRYDNKVTFKLGDNELGTADVVGDTATLTVPATRANDFAIGNNTITLEYSGSGELNPITGSVTVTVNKKSLTATITGATTKTYDGTTSADGLGLELELSDVVDDDDVTASAEFAYDSANAGKRNITAKNATLTGEHAGYYELSAPISTSGTISPLPAEIVWAGDEFAYDGTSHEVTVAVENAVGDDEFKLTYTGNTATEAGDYTAIVTALGNTNYTLNGATGIEHTWKITALSLADAKIEIVGTYTYNGEVQTPEIRVTLGGKELSAGDYTVTYSGEVKGANTYTVTLTGIGNYSGNASAEFEIAPKLLTARISGTLSKVYDGTTDVNDDVEIALTGVIGTDDVTATAEISYDSADAGTRRIVANNITLSGKDAKNYTLSNKQAEVSGSITPAPIDLPNTEFIYGGEAKTVIQVSGIGETVTATLTAFSSNAGEYEYSEVAKEGGYTVELSSENYKVQSAGPLTIKPLVAVIEWQSGEFTYDGKSHTVTATVKNAVAGDKFGIAYTGNTANAAGDYTAKITALGNANYTLNGTNEYEWKIAPRVAVVEWIGDEFTYDGKSHTVTATVKNAVSGDKFSITYTDNTAIEAGDYTAKVTALGNANYTLNGAIGVEHAWKITAAGQAAPEVKIDFINETLSTDEAMEFSVDGETWHDCTAAMNVAKTGWNGSALTVKIRYKKDVDHIEGEVQNLVIPARRAAPDISETTVSKSQTKITIAEIPGCEYSLDGAAWQDSGVFGGLDKGETYEIFVRYKATASAFASFVTSKTVVTSTTAGGATELLPGETVAAGDGSIKNLGGEIIIDDGAGNVTTVTLPDGGSVEVDEQGCVTVPDGGEVAVGDNPTVSLPDGGKVEPDGTVTADEVKVGDTDVKGEDVTVASDGNITVPGEGQVTVGGNPEIILPTGGTVEPDGTVTADEVKVGNTDVKGENVTVAPDGKITLPEGGKVSADGEPEKIVPAGTTVENGKINAPAIAEPVDGESLGDDIVLKIESADERLETADRENLKDAANAIVREVYDIELLKNDVEVQPDKSIKLTVSTDIGGAKMKVFMLDDDGKFNEIDAEFDAENGKFIVVTDSLGIFILASEEGQISAEVVASGGAPEVEIGDDDRKILEENLFTDDDGAAIENGDNVKVVMNVEGVSEEDVSADDIAEIEAFLDDLEGCEVAEYADITLKKITEDGVTGDEIRSEAISEINNPIKLVIDIPEALHKVGRIFSVIRLHDGKAELLNDTDQSDETVTILTDKFSLYVLIYRDHASQPSHVHSFTAWINVGVDGHLARCAICGKVMSLMPHTMLNGVCTACGYSAIFSQPFDESDVIEIEVPTEGMIANEEVVDF